MPEDKKKQKNIPDKKLKSHLKFVAFREERK